MQILIDSKILRPALLAVALTSASCASLSGQNPPGPAAPVSESPQLRVSPVTTELHFGVRDVSSGLLDDVDRQPSFGFSIHNHDAQGDRPFGYEFSGFLSSTEETLDVPGGNVRLEGSMTELAFGLRHDFRPLEGFVPFVGFGFSALLAEREAWGPTGADFDSESKLAVGIYAHGGVYYLLSDTYRLGIDLRATPFTTEVELIEGQAKEDLEHYQATLFFGFSH